MRIILYDFSVTDREPKFYADLKDFDEGREQPLLYFADNGSERLFVEITEEDLDMLDKRMVKARMLVDRPSRGILKGWIRYLISQGWTDQEIHKLFTDLEFVVGLDEIEDERPTT